MTPAANDQCLSSLRPHLAPLRAVRADVNLITARQQRAAETLVSLALPYFPEGEFFQVAEAVQGVLVEATGHHEAVPSDDAGVPEFPAMVEQFVFYPPSAVIFFFVTGVFF